MAGCTPSSSILTNTFAPTFAPCGGSSSISQNRNRTCNPNPGGPHSPPGTRWKLATPI